MPFFSADSPAQHFRRAQKLIEKVLATRGLQPDRQRTAASDEFMEWQFDHGSASVFIFLNMPRGPNADSFVRVLSPLMRVPEEGLTSLYRRLLELNAEALVGFAFGVMHDEVVLVAERSTRDLDESEVVEMLENLAKTSDYFDDKLVAEFGGKRHADVAGR